MKIAVCDDDLIFQRQIKEELDRYYRSLDVLIEVFLQVKPYWKLSVQILMVFLCLYGY